MDAHKIAIPNSIPFKIYKNNRIKIIHNVIHMHPRSWSLVRHILNGDSIYSTRGWEPLRRRSGWSPLFFFFLDVGGRPPAGVAS